MNADQQCAVELVLENSREFAAELLLYSKELLVIVKRSRFLSPMHLHISTREF